MRIHILQHIAYETPGTIITWAEQHQFEVQITKCYEKHKLPSLKDFDTLFIMGGPMSANDEQHYKWIPKEIDFIQACIKAKKITIGICLGAQLIAKALGAHVYKNRVQEIGFYPITKTFAAYKSEYFNPIDEAWQMLHWHAETFDLPEGAIHLFQSKACTHQMFIKNDHILGIQCHPEINSTILEAMVKHSEHEIKDRLYIQSATTLLQQPYNYADLQNKWFGLLNSFILKQAGV